jgi:hypothetical protein
MAATATWRRWTLAGAVAVALAGPTVLAFWSGGFFAEPRLVAGIVTWLLVLVLAVTGAVPLPRGGPGWLAVGGLLLMTAWSAASLAWAPIPGPAAGAVQRLLLYLGALLLAGGLLRGRAAQRVVEPALAAGAVVVIGYGLAGRLLPGIVHEAASARAHGRLEQPITYWNAEGLLAAIGLVLCARLAGDHTRPRAVRIPAAAAAPVLGAGVYLSYSRGAIAAAVVGLVLLVGLAPTWPQLRGAALALASGGLAAAGSAVFHGVASVTASTATRERDGALLLAVLAVLAGAAGAFAAWQTRSEARGGEPHRPLPGARRLLPVSGVVVAIALAGLIAGGLREHGDQNAKLGNLAARLTSVSSNRYEYWRLAWRASRNHPLDGLGAGGYQTYWLRHRKIEEAVQQTHSIELEMAAELGVVGLASLVLLVAGVGLAARRALARRPALAAGMAAASLSWLLHASIDWDWQLPAVSLPALILAGALLALAEEPPDERPAGVAGAAARAARPPVPAA